MECLWSRGLIEESRSSQKRPALVVKKENSNWVVPRSSGCNRQETLPLLNFLEACGGGGGACFLSQSSQPRSS